MLSDILFLETKHVSRNTISVSHLHLLEFKHMLIELLLELFIGVVDTKLFKAAGYESTQSTYDTTHLLTSNVSKP